MSFRHFIAFLIIGGLAGWCAGLLSKGRGFGLAGNVIVGVLGAFLGAFGFGLLGIAAYGIVGQFIFALVGSLVLTWLLGFIRR